MTDSISSDLGLLVNDEPISPFPHLEFSCDKRPAPECIKSKFEVIHTDYPAAKVKKRHPWTSGFLRSDMIQTAVRKPLRPRITILVI
jgi:hypothetical protein